MIWRLSSFDFPDSPVRLYPHTPARPWVLEIGFGDGRFWPHFASTFLEAPNYLGVEISGVSILKARKRLRLAGLTNAILTKLPATPLLREIIPSQALDTIVVNFPDPWPKAGHVEHRLLSASFFKLAASRLKPDGAVLFTTDHSEYFDFACREARASGAVHVQETDAPDSALQTKYAFKWRDLGLSVHHARFTPVKEPPHVPHSLIHRYPHSEELPTVPHAILTLPQTFGPTVFHKRTVRSAHISGNEVFPDARDRTVILLDLYKGLRDNSQGSWVILAHVIDDEITQEVLIGITGRDDGTHLVRLTKFGGPVITPGIKGAIGAVVAWLEEQGATVQHRGY